MTQKLEIRRLQVIFKTVERCNLACPYCYYFEGGDQSFKSRPARTSMAVTERLVEFLERAIDDLKMQVVNIVFHGGEPMLQKIEDFETTCALITDRLGKKCVLELSIQTNGTRLNDAWLAALEKYQVFLGVSIDGPAEIHDPARPYHNGKGSLGTIARSLDKVRRDNPDFYFDRTGSLTVLNAANDYRSISRYFARDLGLRNQSYLLPDCTHDDGIPDGWTARDYGEALCGIFDLWAENHRDWSVREIDDLLRRFQRAKLKPGVETKSEGQPDDAKQVYNHIIVVQSDGELKIDDSYIPASEWRDQAPKADIFTTELEPYLDHAIFEDLFGFIENPPSGCSSCKWVKICHGGDLENRWSSDRGFDNPSVFCDALTMFFEHVTGYLVRNGYPQQFIDQRLTGDYDFVTAGYAA